MSRKEFIKKVLNIQSSLKAPKSQYNSFGKYNYRSLEDILEAVKPLLLEEGLILTISDEVVSIGNSSSNNNTDVLERQEDDILVNERESSSEQESKNYIKVTATLSDGENEINSTAVARESGSKKGMDSAQLSGATSSYARKYALNGLFLIDDTKDADATNDHGKSEPKKTTSRKKASTKRVKKEEEVKEEVEPKTEESSEKPEPKKRGRGFRRK